MANHSLVTLQARLSEEEEILHAAEEDILYHQRMIEQAKANAKESRHHIADLEQTIAELGSKFTVEG